ncbi:peptidylprolyl isomerase [Phenylobacterium sp.]|uniref:peptidylprolyl isomerase n=1 Tax=Phenylobacterium sp. TaxID=1871053 RepID=UPI0025FD8BB3|nr:peptidylprolyl isomerase [Phenylobacterium sp.]MCA3722392.1 SurA N-terminal domain-containing protein [Phenylobacterium sp.]
MLAHIRAFAKSWVAAVLIGLLILSFAVFGVSDVFKTRAQNEVVHAGNRSVTTEEFRAEFDRAKQNLEQQNGQQISNELAVENRFDARVLEMLADREAMAALIEKIGLRPADALITREIQKIPAFFDQVSGRFDKRLYEEALARNKLTAPQFEQSVRDEIAQSHLAAGLVDGLRPPRAFGALAVVFAQESRDLAVFNVGPGAVEAPKPPTDAQLTEFMKANAERLMRPEFRILSVVRFSSAQVAGRVTVSEADIRKQFDFRKDSLNQPETRSLVQIPARDAGTARSVADRLAKGEDPAAVARSAGVEPVFYVDKPRTAVVDAKSGEAAFAMARGEVRTVQGDLGLAVIRVTGITPGRTVTLEEIRPMLEAEARKTAAAEKVYEISQAYDDAHAGGANLDEAAAKAGVPVITLGPLAEQGFDPTGKPVAGLSAKLVQTAFRLPEGGESQIEEESPGESFVVRVDKVIPRTLPPLAEVRQPLAQAWMNQEMAKRLRAKAESLAERVRKGESLDTVAASIGAKPGRLAGLTRQGAAQGGPLSQEGFAEAFGAAKGGVFLAANPTAFAITIGRVEAISPPSAAENARSVEQVRPQLGMTLFSEIGAQMPRYARAALKVRTAPDLARQSLGIETPKAGNEASGK